MSTKKRTKKRKLKARFWIIVLVLAVIIFGVIIFAVFRGPAREEPPKKGHILYNITHAPSTQLEEIDVDLLSSFAEVYDLSGRKVLFTKDADGKARPASLTKMMTALVFLENTKDLDRKTAVPASVVKELEGTDIARLDLYAGEKLSGKDLLYGLLLSSAADCAYTMAEKTAGSEKAFVKMMNEKAEKLGMKNTSFGNPVGLDDDKTYTTASDLIRLMRHALKNKTFRKVITSKKYTIEPTNKRSTPISLHSTVFSKFENGSPYVRGGKTGTTDGAQNCLATLAEINGNQYLCVTCHAETTYDHPLPSGEDAETVYEEIDEQIDEIIEKEYK